MNDKLPPTELENRDLPVVTIDPERFASVHTQVINGEKCMLFAHGLYVRIGDFDYPDAFLGLWTSSQRPDTERPLCQGAIDLGDERGLIALTDEECYALSPLVPWSTPRAIAYDAMSAYSMTEYGILEALRERVAAARAAPQERQ